MLGSESLVVNPGLVPGLTTTPSTPWLSHVSVTLLGQSAHVLGHLVMPPHLLRCGLQVLVLRGEQHSPQQSSPAPLAHLHCIAYTDQLIQQYADVVGLSITEIRVGLPPICCWHT